jgi:hypothetical protein
MGGLSSVPSVPRCPGRESRECGRFHHDRHHLGAHPAAHKSSPGGGTVVTVQRLQTRWKKTLRILFALGAFLPVATAAHMQTSNKCMPNPKSSIE